MISIQNDGSRGDRFKVSAPGARVTNDWRVGYLLVTGCRDHCPITSAVRAGTYRTPRLAPGEQYFIMAVLTARIGFSGNVRRLVTIKSVGDPTKEDAVKFVLKEFTDCGC